MSEEKYKYTGPTIIVKPKDNPDYYGYLLFKDSKIEAEINIAEATIVRAEVNTHGLDDIKMIDIVPVYVSMEYLEPVKPEPISFQEDKDQGYIDKLYTLCNLNGLKMTIEKPFSDRLKVSFFNPDGSEAMTVTESPDKVYEYAFDHLNLSLKENGYKYYKGDAIWPYVEKEIDRFEEGFKLVPKDFVRKWEEANRWDSISEGWDKICQRAWREKYGDTYYTPKKVMDAINDDFDAILSEMSDTHKAKNHDYGDSFTELYKECGSTYAYAHLKEKLSRIKTLRKSRQQVKQESLRDSLMDLASYSVMWIVELDKKGKEDEQD